MAFSVSINYVMTLVQLVLRCLAKRGRMKYSRLRIAAALIIAFVISLTALSISCTGKKSKSADLLVKSSILKKIPPASFGFVVMNNTGEAYKRFAAKNSSSKQLDSLISSISKHPTLANWIESSGLFDVQASKSAAIEEGVVFLNALSNSSQVDVGLFGRTKSDFNLTKEFSRLKEAFRNDGIEVAEEKAEGIEAFSVPVEQFVTEENAQLANFTAQLNKIYFASAKNLFAITSNKKHMQRLFSPAIEDGMSLISKSKNYQRALQSAELDGDHLSFFYLDLQSFVSRVSSTVKDQIKETSSFELEDLPVESVIASRKMTSHLKDEVKLLLNAKKQDQKDFISKLKNAGSLSALKMLPAGTVIALNLKGVFAATISESFANEDKTAKQTTKLKDYSRIIEMVDDFALGIVKSEQPSPFPAIIATIKHRNAALYDELKSYLSSALSSSGLPLSQWQKKELSGVPVDYVMSPLGVGIVLAKINDLVLLGSSEQIVAKTIKSISEGSDLTLGARLNERIIKEHFSARASLLSFFINGESLAGLMRGVQGSLAMFMGGAASPELEQQILSIKSLGSIFWSVRLDDKEMIITGNYDVLSKQQ